LTWINPQECAHLTTVIMQELEAHGFQIVNEAAMRQAPYTVLIPARVPGQMRRPDA
jgi:hypothetical protein